MTRQADTSSSVLGTVTRVLLIGGSFILIGAAVKNFLLRPERTSATTDRRRDKTLKDSFPASDPPSSQYFDIPVNRQ